MNESQLVTRLPEILRSYWRLDADSVAPLGGGMNSTTALVTADHRKWVAKWVTAAGSVAFQHGVRVAAQLAAAKMRSGRPLPTVDSKLFVAIETGSLALLEFVPGRELTPQVADQPRQAEALGKAHTVLGTIYQRADFFDWLGDDPRIGGIADWALPAITAGVAEYQALPPVTWGIVHADPSPEAFILDESTGTVGIIDWAGATRGPLLYDVASAVWYLGGTDTAATFLARYAECGPVPADELARHLTTFRRFRAVVQTDYFARRILANDLTGIDSPAENDRGLQDAKRTLQRLGML